MQAQDKPSLVDASLEDLMNVKVSTASKHLQLARDAPAFATVITREEIQRYGHRTLADALESVGGFFITNDRNYSYVGVRGFGRPGDYNTRILLLVDGHRMNDAIFDSALVGTEFPLDIDLVERIEIVRGPGASLYGTNAFFAVVNVITRSATPEVRIETSMQGQSFGGVQGRMTLTTKVGGTDVVASASAYHSEGQSLSSPAIGDPNDGTTSGADFDSSYSMFLHLRRGHWRLQSLYGSRDKGIPTGAFETAISSGTHTIDNRGYTEARYEAAKGKWDVLVRAAYDAYYYAGTYLGIPDANGVSVVNRDYARADTVSTEISLARNLGGKHHLTTGGELRLNLRQAQGNYDVDPPMVWFRDQRRSWVAAGFVQDEYRPWRFLLLNIGMRLDQYSTAGTNVNPRLGLIWQPGERTAVKLLYGTAFRTPNAFELYYTSVPSNAGTPLHLTAERIQTAELIVERALGNNARFEGVVFRNDISKLISETSDPLTDSIVYRNMEKVRATGVDLQIEGKAPQWHFRSGSLHLRGYGRRRNRWGVIEFSAHAVEGGYLRAIRAQPAERRRERSVCKSSQHFAGRFGAALHENQFHAVGRRKQDNRGVQR